GSIRAVHAGHRDRPFTGLAIVDGNDAAPIDAPGHFMLVFASRHAGVALDAAIGVAEKLHSSHGRLLRRRNLTKCSFGLLHARHRVKAVSGERIYTLPQHHRVGSLRIFPALVDTLEPAREVEGAPGHALADPFRDESFHLGPRPAVGGTGDPHPSTVL